MKYTVTLTIQDAELGVATTQETIGAVVSRVNSIVSEPVFPALSVTSNPSVYFAFAVKLITERFTS